LKDEQEQTVNQILKHKEGILVAPPGSGKTVMALEIVTRLKLPAIILVHRNQLLHQWVLRTEQFLGIPKAHIGVISGVKKKLGKQITVASLQSLVRYKNREELQSKFGVVIVDECHHIAAFSFDQVMKQVKARYVFGLTATSTRKDGHHPIIIMQCGPVRHRVNPKDAMAESPYKHVFKIRYTDFHMPFESPNPHISEVYGALAADEKRNRLIIKDILESLEAGSTPLLLTEPSTFRARRASAMEARSTQSG
jgi:superfamily II DNA or RNA helicase